MQDGYLGTVLLAAFTSNRVPQYWALCNGQLLSISQYTALFSLIGTNFGGDGITNFALPNLSAEALQPGMNYIICIIGIYPNFN